MLPEFCSTSQTHATCSCVKPNIKGSPPPPLVRLSATGERCVAATAAAAEGVSITAGGMLVD